MAHTLILCGLNSLWGTVRCCEMIVTVPTYIIFFVFSCMYNVGKLAIVWVLMRRVAVKRLISVHSMAGSAFVVYVAGSASAELRDVAVVTRCCDEKRWTECWEQRCLGWWSARLGCRATSPRRAAWPVCRALLLGSWCVVCDVYCFTYWWQIDE
jgi:hypothetical protein